MAYLISEEAQDLLQDVKNFCDKEVVEQCKEYDVSGEWPKAIYDKAVEQGYQALEVPEEFGGPGLSRVDVAALIEQMAIADAGFATTISASGHGMKPVLIAGTDEQKQHVCDLILDGGFGAFCLTEPGAGSGAGSVELQIVFQINGSASPETVEALREYGDEFAERVLEVMEEAGIDTARRAYK